MEELVTVLAGKYPTLLGVFSLIGILRAINKPLFAAIRAVVSATATTKDDQALDRIEASKGYKAFLFSLDWMTSIKLPAKK